MLVSFFYFESSSPLFAHSSAAGFCLKPSAHTYSRIRRCLSGLHGLFTGLLIIGTMFFGAGVVETVTAQTQGVTPQKLPVLVREVLVERDAIPLTFFLDSWVLPESVTLLSADGTPADTTTWRFIPTSGEIEISEYFLQNNELSAKISISYSRLPVSLRMSYFRRMLRPLAESDTHTDSANGLENQDISGLLVSGRRETQPDLFGPGRLNRSGSITRGITVGTNQDASLESGLQFEFSGNITDDLELTAILTDQSTPIQPDGSTQNLREFDQVLIRLQHERASVQLGDVDVSLRNSAFAQIERRLQGLETRVSAGDWGDWQASASVVRGRFRTMSFSGREGVQGPYRLTGSQGEQFIIVLAGTERVYLNGELLSRGEENDYIIDYGLGEIEFTRRRIISGNHRLVVDFQYVTQEYNRTLLTAESEFKQLYGGRLSVGATFIQESDSRELNAEFGLTDEEIRILEQAGRNVENAVISGADSVGFRLNPDFIPYARVDTVQAGITYTVFRAAPGDPAGVWRVRFSRVGDGLGSYRRTGTNLNGIVYEWAGPGLGSYEPFRRIPAPQQQRMLALRSRFGLSESVELYGETAFSELDVNRFAADDTRTQAAAWQAGIDFLPTQTRIGRVKGTVRYRNTPQQFVFFDRTREAEFDRIWNIPTGTETGEKLAESEISVDFTGFSSLTAGLGNLERSDVNSTRGFLRLNLAEPGGLNWMQRADAVRSSYGKDDIRSSWLRQSGRFSYTVSSGGTTLTPRLESEAELRTQRSASSDSLLAGSFRFAEITPGLQSVWGNGLSTDISAGYRADEEGRQGSFAAESQTFTGQIRTQYDPVNRLQLSAGLLYQRRVQADNPELETAGFIASAVLFNAGADYRTAEPWFQLQWQYEGGTESRPLLQETYIEVGPELGNYVWVDLNGDGVRQIDEFFPAVNPDEGTFLRLFIPGDELIPVVSVNTRLRTRIEPGALLPGSWWEELALNTLIEIREQNEGSGTAEILLLQLGSFLDDKNTVEGRLLWQQELQLFRRNRAVDLRLRFTGVDTKNRRTGGLETTLNRTFSTDASYRVSRAVQLGSEFRYEKRDLKSERFSSRAYQIRGVEAAPFLRYTFSRSLQATGGYGFGRKQDLLPAEPVRLFQNRAYTDLRWFAGSSLQTTARAEWRSNTLRGQTSSLGSFELTDGAGTGSTWQWSVKGTYRINQYLRANISYNGRTVQQQQAIQTLRVSVSAVF